MESQIFWQTSGYFFIQTQNTAGLHSHGFRKHTNQSLPFSIGLCDLIHTAHLTVCHASHNEDYDPGARLYLCGASVLVPVAIASTAWWEQKHIST